jgi:hypothetical protein
MGLDFALVINYQVHLIIFLENRRYLNCTTCSICCGEGQQRSVGLVLLTEGWELSVGYAETLDNGLYFNVTTNFGATKQK